MKRNGWVGDGISVEPCSCCAKRQELTQEKTRKEVRKDWHQSFLTPDLVKTRARPNVLYEFQGKPKLLLVRNAVSKKIYAKTLDVLERLDKQGSFKSAKDSGRGAVKQMLGGELLFGWFKGHTPPNDPITNITRDQWYGYVGLWDMMRELHDGMAYHMSEYFAFHDQQANRLARPSGSGSRDTEIVDPLLFLDRQDDPVVRANIESEMNWTVNYLVWGTSFSSITVNKSIVFTAHEDGRNMPDTLGALTALGDFVGGTLVFPRYGIGADVGPRDILFCDSNEEYHGNLGPIFGKRYSIVGYLHKSLLSRTFHHASTH